MTGQPSDLIRRIEASLIAFASGKREQLTELGPAVGELIDLALESALGGKHMRPAFCLAGWESAGGGDDERALRAAASLEWLQASALVHDDLMDASDTRRGRPAAHRRFEQAHADRGWRGSAAQFGLGGAVLLGDLLLTWCDDMFRSSGFDPAVLWPASRYLDAAKSEVVGGQFLDVVNQNRGDSGLEDALRVIRFKTAKYTVERPLHIGAALAGADAELIATLSAIGLPLGEAFQLRDDVLGVFGDPARTGKPAGDDIVEGKRTVLVAHALQRASPHERLVLEEALGNRGPASASVAAASEVIVSTGALATVEETIIRLADEAAGYLPRIGSASARATLEELLIATTRRDK